MEAVPELGKRRPAGVRLRLDVVVRLVVQVLDADRAEAGAVGAAENLVRQLQCQGVARPGREVEPVVLEVRRAQLLVTLGRRRLVLARRDRQVENGVLEAAEAGPVQANAEAELEDRPGGGPSDRQLRRHFLGHRQVVLAPEFEPLELDLAPIAKLLPGANLDRTQVERGHAGHGSNPCRV